MVDKTRPLRADAARKALGVTYLPVIVGFVEDLYH